MVPNLVVFSLVPAQIFHKLHGYGGQQCSMPRFTIRDMFDKMVHETSVFEKRAGDPQDGLTARYLHVHRRQSEWTQACNSR